MMTPGNEISHGLQILHNWRDLSDRQLVRILIHIKNRFQQERPGLLLPDDDTVQRLLSRAAHRLDSHQHNWQEKIITALQAMVEESAKDLHTNTGHNKSHQALEKLLEEQQLLAKETSLKNRLAHSDSDLV